MLIVNSKVDAGPYTRKNSCPDMTDIQTACSVGAPDPLIYRNLAGRAALLAASQQDPRKSSGAVFELQYSIAAMLLRREKKWLILVY